MPTPSTNDPSPDCTACGACCAYSNNWPEFSDADDLDGVPESMCDCENGRMKCDGDRCVALVGVIGERVHCSVYPSRPLVCREFIPGSPDCNTVRAYFGLPPGISPPSG